MARKLRTCLFLSVHFLTTIGAYSQVQLKTDSLYRRIESAKEDTSRINAYFAFALFLEDINLDSASKYYKIGGELSRKINYYEGISHYAKNYSVVLNMQGRFEESMELHKILLELASARNNQSDIAKTYNNIASVYNHQGQYDSAYYYYIKSAKLFEQLKDDRYLNIIYQNIAIILDDLSQYGKSLNYHRMAIEKSRSQNDTPGVASVMLNAAGTLNKLHRYDSALVLSLEALRLSKTIDNLYYQQVACITIGNIYAQKKKFDAALENFRSALDIATKMNYPSGVSVALTGLAMTSLKMGKFKDADRYALQSLSFNTDENRFSELTQQLKLVADIKAQLKQYDSAYHYLLKYTTLQDSLAGINTKKHIADLELKYETALKDKSIAQQLLEIRQNQDKIESRNKWLWIAFGILVVVMAISAASYISYRSKKQLLGQEIVTLQKEKELESMKASMEAREQERQRIAREMHDDLGAGLTSIVYQVNALKQSQQATDDVSQIDKITDTSTELVAKMRDIVWAMNYENDTLDNLVAYIRHQSGSMLSHANIGYEIDTPEEILPIPISGVQRRNVYLACKEALHNVIKHANATQVSMYITINGTLNIRIADNGKGFAGGCNKKGNGLRNMQARMQQSGGYFSIEAVERGTVVNFLLPLYT